VTEHDVTVAAETTHIQPASLGRRLSGRVVMSLVLGLLGPHPSVHVHEVIGRILFELPSVYRSVERSSGPELARSTVHGLIELYLVYSLMFFALLSLLSWATRRKRAHGPNGRDANATEART